MSIYKKTKYPFLLLPFLCCISTAHAEDTIPIPRKRPTILNVSPAYIEELRNRDKAQKTIPEKTSPSSTFDTKNQEINNNSIFDNGKESEIIKVDRTSLLSTLDENNATSIPVPKTKPSLNDIEPAAAVNEDYVLKKNKNVETTLVSFVLKPTQINLDKNLELFLKKHALQLFSNDKNLKMEIHAYATPIDGELHSDVRLSLARALEVRSFLISNNISPSRLKLSPMGRDTENGGSDRIDLLFIAPQ